MMIVVNAKQKNRKVAARLLLANELRSYREVLARVISIQHPGIEVHQTKPEGLDRSVVSLEPYFVICSRATLLMRLRVPVWVELYTDHGASSTINVCGRIIVIEDLQLPGLLDLLGRYEDVASSA